MSDIDTHLDWLDKIENEGVNVSAWEQEFCESLRARLERQQLLSEKQLVILEQIYATKTP